MAGPGDVQRPAGGAVRLSATAAGELGEAVEAVEALVGAGGDPDDRVDATVWHLESSPLSTLLASGRLERLTGLPVGLSVVALLGNGEVRTRFRPLGAYTVEINGPIHETIANEEAFRASARAGRGRDVLKRIAAATPGIKVKVTAEVVNDPGESGFHWMRTLAGLQRRLEESWLATLETLFEGEGAVTVVVADGDEGHIRAGALQVCGPAATGQQLDNPEPAAIPSLWWGEHRRDRQPLPAPAAILPAECSGTVFEELASTLTGVTCLLAWLWLADAVDDSDDIPEATFSGQRIARVALEVRSAVSAADELSLWAWAMEDSDPARFEAIQIAVASAVFHREDLWQAAKPARRTARTLLRALRRDELAEAMATLRTVRDAAVAAGRAAADAGRAAGAKSLERLVVQAAAAAGILIANSGDAISAGATKLLLSLVLGLLLASGVIALLSDYPAAYGVLASFKRDLMLYEDTLDAEDIAEIERMRSLEDAFNRISLSLAITITVFVLALAGLIFALTAV